MARCPERPELAARRIPDAFKRIDAWAPDPHNVLPEELFVFISRLTPIVNVDLLIRDPEGRLLLTWRSDEIDGAGWHIPGGIIRYKEDAACRIQATAQRELGIQVEFEANPVAIQQVIHPTRRERGHFISLAYDCRAIGSPQSSLRYDGGPPQPGQWKWHAACPPDLIAVHRMYRCFFRSS